MKENPKYFMCLFMLENHTTWRLVVEGSLEKIGDQLGKCKDKVLKKRFFEIDRVTGEMEEF
jgi:hypothetical protein